MLVVATGVKRQTAKSRSTALHCTALHCTAPQSVFVCLKKSKTTVGMNILPEE